MILDIPKVPERSTNAITTEHVIKGGSSQWRLTSKMRNTNVVFYFLNEDI